MKTDCETRAGQLQATLCEVRRRFQQQISKISVLIEQETQLGRVTIKDITLWLRNIIYKGIPKENVTQRVVSQILEDNMNLEWIPMYQKKKIIYEAQKKQTYNEMELELRPFVS